jgi:Tfp pilus assembly protein PilV
MTSPGAHSGTSLRDRCAGEGGWALIETMVSAVLLIAITIAVAASLDTASRATAENKGRSVAATLAEQDQERMRAMNVTQLSNYHPAAQTLATPDGTSYSVASRSDWIRDSTNAPESCSSNNTQPDYLRITSTVTSRVVGTDIQPVIQRSVVAPPVGSLGPNQGTFSAKLLDGASNPVANFGVTAASSANSYSDITNSLGCAVFGYIPSGKTYTATASQSGYVDPDGNATATASAVVNAGKVTNVQLSYDRAGSIAATLTGPAPSSSGIMIAQSKWSSTAPRAWPVPAGQTSVTATGLFPFSTSNYSVYAGSCAAADPSLNGGIAPTALVTPNGTTPVTVKLPPVTVTVKKGSSTPASADIKLTASGSGCTDTAMVTTTTGIATIKLPYGTYDICADDNSGRRVGSNGSNTVTNKDAGAAVTVDLNSSWWSSGSC